MRPEEGDVQVVSITQTSTESLGHGSSSEERPLHGIPEELRPAPPPNGGLTAWIQVMASFLLFFNTIGMVNSFGVFQGVYTEKLLKDHTPSQISWIGSLQPFLLFIITLFTGPLFDMGYCRHLLISGTILSVFGFFMTSLCTQYWQFVLAQGIVMGTGFGLLFIPTTAVVPAYFGSRRVIAIGLGVSGTAVGAVVYPVMFRALEPRIGFAWATRALAFVMLASLVLAGCMVRVRRLPAVARPFWDPAAVRSPSFWWFNIAVLTGYTAIFVPYYYSVLFAQHVGTEAQLGPGMSWYTLPILNAGRFFGSIVPALIADRLGSFDTITASTALAAVLGWAWIAVHNARGFVAWAVCFGLMSGAYVTLQVACIAVIVVRERDMQFFGAWLGINHVFVGIGTLIGPPIAGAILGRKYDWTGLQSWVAVVATASTLFFLVSRYYVSRK